MSTEPKSPAREMNERDFLLAVLDLPEEQRQEFIERKCGGNLEQKVRIEQLLRNTDTDTNFMAQPVLVLPPTAAIGPNQPTPAVGIQIDRYKLMEQIGEGGMGIVFVAEQLEPVRRKVALKIIKPGMDSKQVIARFEAERQALALMEHSNIARVFDAGTTAQGLPYFVMELVRGLPITEYCDRTKSSTKQRLELFISVCNAIQHAHQKGIVHRDIKPSNVLITLHDGTPVVKVIDFGVAKALHQQLSTHTIYTALNQVIGTPLYMSPEQLELSGLDIDTRTDIYSLGVLLYELLTGQTPFDREHLLKSGYDEMRRIIREQDPPRPSQRITSLEEDMKTTAATHRGIEIRSFAGSVRGELDWITMKSIEKDRNRRYDTASGLAADVQRFLDDEPVLASPPSASYRIGKTVRRNRALLSAAGLIVLALSIGTAVSTWQAYRAMVAEAVAEQNLESVNEERDKAEKGLAIASDCIDRMVSMISSSGFLQVPDGHSTRKEIFTTAVEFCDRLIEQYPHSSRAYKQRGRAQSSLMNADQAISDYTKAIELDPRNHEALHRLSVIFRSGHLNRYDPKKSLQYIDRALELMPDNLAYCLEKAAVLGHTGDIPQAIRLLTNITALDPSHSEAYRWRANFEFNRGNIAQSFADAKKAVELNPTNCSALGELGNAFMGMNRIDEALDAYSEAVRVCKYNHLAHKRRGYCLFRMQRYDEAIREYDESIKIVPDDQHLYDLRAASLLQLGHFEAALDDLRHCIRLKNDAFSVLVQSRMAFLKCKDEVIHSSYLAIIDEMVILNKNSDDSLLTRARILVDYGNFERATADIQTVLATGKASYNSLYKASLLALQIGDRSLYRNLCKGMLVEFSATSDPDIASIVAWTIALSPNAVENYQAAIVLAQRAVELKPEARVHLSRLAAVQFRSGDFEAAHMRIASALEMPVTTQHSLAYDFYFQAMIVDRRGQSKLASELLEKADQKANQELGDLVSPPSWNRVLTLELLKTEATQMLAHP